MPWDIHDADPSHARQVDECETNVNGHPARFLFRKPVSIYTGEGADQARFAVIHMASSSN